MKRIFILPLLVAPLVLGQGMGQGKGPGGAPGPMGQRAGLNVAAQVTVEGTISALTLSYGAQYPAVTVNQKVIRLAPVWYLLDNGMELALNDKVKVVAAPSSVAGDTALYALAVTKGTQTLQLRDAAGVPLWLGRGGQEQAPRSGEPCLDFTNLLTAQGTVASVEAGVGIQYPSLVLKLADGSTLTFKLGPERVLLAADFELKAGEALKVTYVTCPESGELVALTLTNAAGVTLTLRDPGGWPMRP